MIPYARQSIDDADVEAVVRVLRSDFLTQGPVVPRFEACVADYCGARHGVAVSNATAALHLSAAALSLGPGGLLWTSPVSFVASANCALYCGADVDFVDIDERTYNLDIGALREKLREADARGRLPDVIVMVDFAGQPCDYAALAGLKKQYGFHVIQDASHAIGASHAGTRIGSGTCADVTVFSFHPVKIITTAEGGMAVTNDDALAETLRLLRSHGVTRDPQLMTRGREPWEYEQIALGFNYRLTEIQAALGLEQMRRIDAFVERRRALAARYDAAFEATPVQTPYEAPYARSSYHLYAVQVDARKDVYVSLRERGIAPNVHYMPIYRQPFYEALGFREGYCPRAEAYYARALSLPMFPELTDSQQDAVIAAVLNATEIRA